MDKTEDQIGAILNDPEKMKKIMALAQSFQETTENTEEASPGIDPALLQKISGIMAKGGMDRNQKNLLNALAPYLNRQRISRLERAMRAAKLADAATGLLGDLHV